MSLEALLTSESDWFIERFKDFWYPHHLLLDRDKVGTYGQAYKIEKFLREKGIKTSYKYTSAGFVLRFRKEKDRLKYILKYS
jgi:hypothetical protein